ncbi:MAG: hypothetical protein Q9226_005637, partial [Calogaya cf. arnoldii]
MSIDYRKFSLLLLSLVFPTVINSSPHPQRGGRHRHERPAENTVAVTPPTTTLLNENNAVIRQGTLPEPTVINNSNDDEADTDDDTTTTTTRGSSSSTPTNGPIIPSTSTGSSGGKRGLAYNSSSPSLQVFANSEITWVHNWYSAPDGAPSEFLFVPTLWGPSSPHSDNWETLAAGYQYLMSFNEPDIVGQANMEVGEA